MWSRNPFRLRRLIEVRNELLEVLDQELLMETDDEMYQAIEKARTAVFEAVTERATPESADNRHASGHHARGGSRL